VSDGPMDATADAAENWVRSWTASVSERAAAAQSLSDQVAKLKVAASDGDRMITVTVNGSGVMIDLRLSQEAARLNMDDLASMILHTMRRAQAALADRVADIAHRTVGRDSDTASAVVFSFEHRFPVPSNHEERDHRPDWPFHGR
jgi:DNA-binding protein YbaB